MNETQQQRAKRVVDLMMHQAHLRYQREALAPDASARTLPPAEVRGVRVKHNTVAVFKPEWFTGLRPNFWKGYFETLVFMGR